MNAVCLIDNVLEIPKSFKGIAKSINHIDCNWHYGSLFSLLVDADNYSAGGFNDWRITTYDELESIMENNTELKKLFINEFKRDRIETYYSSLVDLKGLFRETIYFAYDKNKKQFICHSYWSDSHIEKISDPIFKSCAIFVR